MLVTVAGNFTLRAKAATTIGITLKMTGGSWEIDWGDGTVEPIVNATRINHTYASAYTGGIKISCTDSGTDEPTEIILHGFPEFDVAGVHPKITNIELPDCRRVYCSSRALPAGLARLVVPSIDAVYRDDVDRILKAARDTGNTPIILLGSQPAGETTTGLAPASEIVPPRALEYPATGVAPYARLRNDGVATFVAGNIKGVRNGTPRPHQPGQCATFDGVGDYVRADNLAIPDQLTISVWFNLDSSPTQSSNTVFAEHYGSGDRIQLDVITHSTDALLVRNWIVQAGSTTYLESTNGTSWKRNAWNHLAVTYDFTTNRRQTYINGELVGEDTTQDVAKNGLSQGSYWWGCREGVASFFTGKLFDGRKYTRVLSASEIAQLAALNQDSTDLGPTDSLLGWWPLSDENYRVARDISGNNNHGDITATSVNAFRLATDAPYSLRNMQGYHERPEWIVDETVTGESHDYRNPPAAELPSSFTVEAFVTTTKSVSSYLLERKPVNGGGSRLILAWAAANGSGNHGVFDNVAWHEFGSAAPSSDGNEHHIAFVVSGTSVSCYIDGVQSGSTATIGAAVDNTRAPYALYLRGTGGDSLSLDGRVRSLRVHDFAMSAAEVAAVASGNPNDNGLIPFQADHVAGAATDAEGNSVSSSNLLTGPVPRDPVLKTACLKLEAAVTDLTALGDLATAGLVTVSFWMKSSAVTGLFRIGPASGAARVELNTFTGFVWLRLVNDGGTTTYTQRVGTIPILDGKWHNITVQVESQDADANNVTRIWVDGVEDGIGATTAFTGAFTPFNRALESVVNGTVPLARLGAWNRALTSAERTSLLHKEDVAGSVFFYECSEGDGLNLWDRSANGNHGALTTSNVGAAWAEKWSGSQTIVRDGYFLRDQLGVKTAVPKRIAQSFAADGNSITHGPGVIGPGQRLVLDHNEPNSAFAQKYLSLASSHDYDGPNQANILYSPASNNAVDILESAVGTELQPLVAADYASR